MLEQTGSAELNDQRMHCGVLGGKCAKRSSLCFPFFLSFWLSNEMTTTNARRVEVASEGKGTTLVFWLLRLHACFLGA